jgi:glycosyltransferase involved in cell wall biosynthesis
MRSFVNRVNDSIPTSSDWINRTISIVIASGGRPKVLDETLESVFRQSQRPQQVIVVVPTVADAPRKEWRESIQLIVGPRGGCVQRNKALEAIPLSVDYVGFFDDDFELRVDFLEQATLFMGRNPATIAFSGHILADGNGITRAEARRLLAHHTHGENLNGLFRSKGKFHSLYGCNMIIRRSILDYEKFDENLPLYSFAEDYDLSMRLERYGNIGKFGLCVGVHLAAPGGRVPEVQRGYSFVANPWYFLKKGTVHLPAFLAWIRFWLTVCGGTFLFTLWKVLTRDRSLDWGGRLKGVLLAFWDLVLGRSHPRRILELQSAAGAGVGATQQTQNSEKFAIDAG